MTDPTIVPTSTFLTDDQAVLLRALQSMWRNKPATFMVGEPAGIDGEVTGLVTEIQEVPLAKHSPCWEITVIPFDEIRYGLIIA